MSSEFRGRKIATKALHLVEEIAIKELGLEMVQLDVVPRNKIAFDFYYKNGYINLISFNLRKTFGDSPRNQTLIINGKELKI